MTATLCTYYRRGLCTSPSRCSEKARNGAGQVVCSKDGKVGQVDKESYSLASRRQ